MNFKCVSELYFNFFNRGKNQTAVSTFDLEGGGPFSSEQGPGAAYLWIHAVVALTSLAIRN